MLLFGVGVWLLAFFLARAFTKLDKSVGLVERVPQTWPERLTDTAPQPAASCKDNGDDDVNGELATLSCPGGCGPMLSTDAHRASRGFTLR